jgi:winged helix-turn helix protein
MDKMSERQWKRWDAIAAVNAGKLTMAKAAQLVGCSQRQLRRVRQRIAQAGQAGLRHGNTGRSPTNKLPSGVRETIERLGREKYEGFNDHHFRDKLETGEKIAVSVSMVRRLRRAAGVSATRRRQPPVHRRRRDRKAQAGLMVLWDGSHHDWLQGRGPALSLIGAIDDATSELLPGAHFVEQECAAGYLRVIHAIIQSKGVPWSMYMDRHGSLSRNDEHWSLEEELRGKRDPTQVGRALQSLEIEVIFALSAQAKGRVERLWGTLQDRLVSELRLAKANMQAQANAVLPGYREEHTRLFAVSAANSVPAWRAVRRGLDLARVCSLAYEATVLDDNTVRLGGQVIDIPPNPRQRSYAGKRVEVNQLLDGSWTVYWQDTQIATAPATSCTELRTLKRRKRKGRGRADL